MSKENLFETKLLHALELAFDHPSDDRKAWVEATYADDKALLARLLEAIGSEESSTNALRTGGAREHLEDEHHPNRIGTYRIDKLIGRGGMGAVYTATRIAGDFEHNVAIKIIRPGVLSTELIERFEVERQILAQLNHPNIARLFDGGTSENGSPYIIMEYVEGLPIIQWMEDEQTSLDKRMTIFLDVCRAVQYAHQNLIVHRDITPSNVLVTHNGIAKLIDFGISKPEATPDPAGSRSNNQTDSMTYTPGYAAPERMTGVSASTLSDIYSLGRLLLDVTKPNLPNAELEAIVDKATREDPSDRYTTVESLADDIRHFRSGLPVVAYKGGGLYRFKKFLLRRKLAISFGAVGLAGLITALGVTLFQYQRAEDALLRANERFEQARALSRTLIFDTYDEFAKISGTLEPRRQLANLVTDYVDQLASDDKAPRDIVYDVGIMKSRLSDIYGGIGVPNLGDTEKSGALIKEANEALEQLHRLEPDDTSVLAELVMARRILSMQSLIYHNDTVEALRINDEVLSHASQGVEMADENEQTLLRHFWSGRTDRLQILRDMDHNEEALQQVQGWRTELDSAMFERLGGGEEMAAYLSFQEAELLNILNRGEEAEAALGYVIEYRNEQLKANPDNYYQKTQLMVALMELSSAHAARKQFDALLETSTQVVEIAREIRATNLEDTGSIEGLNDVLQNHATYLHKSGKHKEARQFAKEALDLALKMEQEFPGNAYYQDILLDSRITLISVSTASQTNCKTLLDSKKLYEALSSSYRGEEVSLTNLSASIEREALRNGCAD